MKAKVLTVMISSALAAWSGAASADSLLQFRSDVATCRVDLSRIAISGSRVRMDGSDPAHARAVIYDNAEKFALTLDIDGRSYGEVELDEETLDYLGDVHGSLQAHARSRGIDLDNPQATADACAEAMAAGNPGACGGRRRGAAYGIARAAGGARVPAADIAGAGGVVAANPEQRMAPYDAMMKQQMSDAQYGQYKKAVEKSMQAFAARDALANSSDRESGQEKRIDGIACRVRQHFVAGRMVAEDCLADTSALALPAADAARLKSMIAVYARFIAAAGAGIAGTVRGIREPDRFPLERVCYQDGRAAGRATLEVSHGEQPAALFDVPAGFRAQR